MTSAPWSVSEDRAGVRTLAVDIGGTGIKMLVLDAEARALGPRLRRPTPRPAHPGAVLDLIRGIAPAQLGFERVSAGFPGVVRSGVVCTAPNLESAAWTGFHLERALRELFDRPARAVNDADMQGYGVIQGAGVELVLTLGTGMGAALFTNGHLVPNLELGHHPFERNKTYEERVCDAELSRIGKKRWRRRVARVVRQLEPIWNYDRLYIGGGNARHLPRELPTNVRVFQSVEGLAGGVRLWRDEPASELTAPHPTPRAPDGALQSESALRSGS